MTRLSWDTYGVVESVLYRVLGDSASNDRNWILESVDPTVDPRRREVPAGGPGFQVVSPSAKYRGTQVGYLEFLNDGQVQFGVWPYPSNWPAEIPLERYGNPERAGDGFWTGTIAFSELEDFDDGIPEDWRPFLPADDVDGVE